MTRIGKQIMHSEVHLKTSQAKLSFMKLAPLELHFITGKGGVGKSLVAASLALKRSLENKRTLLVELGDTSFYQDFFDILIGYEPSSLSAYSSSFDVALWSGPAALKDYAVHLVKIEALYNLFFDNLIMRTFIDVAPGLQELALLGKATSGPRRVGPKMDYDCIVVDAFSTGHFLALLRAPRGLSEAVSMGPMGEQSRGILNILKNPSICRYTVVSTSDGLAVTESIELFEQIQAEVSIKPSLVMNKCLPEIQEEGSRILKDFSQYLKAAHLKQERARTQYRQKSMGWSEVPFVFENESWPLLQRIQESLRSL